jgi:hypothetical protein
VLHDCCAVWSREAAHSLPPYSASCDTVKVAVCMLPPQDTSQVVHAVQAPTQSTEHGSVLHTCESRRNCWQSTPLYMASCTTVNVRVESPMSQSSEHTLHDPHEPTQSIGQFTPVLHD